MTAYVVASTQNFPVQASGTLYLAIRAGSFEVKINRVEYGVLGGQGSILPALYRYAGSTISGGTALTPPPLRQGAPAATATARMGALTLAGTQSYFTHISAALGGGSMSNYTPAYDITISPGSAFVMAGGYANQGNGTITFAMNAYFEELRLAWHY